MAEYQKLLTQLQPHKSIKNAFTALDLFAGCGGLALGFEAAGFKTIGYEKDPDAVATYRANLLGKCNQTLLTTKTIFPSTDLIIGGPPCQPFSVGGKQMGLKDSRDGFPIFINAIKQQKPRMWLFENVRGMLYKNKHYLNEVINELECLGYVVSYKLLKAVHYQVPQNRERLFVVGYKDYFHFPNEFSKKFTVGDALSDIAYQTDVDTKFLTKNQDVYIARYEKASKCINPRDLYMDRPSRTVTCRNLAGATGDMLRIKLPDGRRKRLSVREGARLQSFPDWYKFHSSENSQFSQIGNAVPPLLAYHLAKTMLVQLQDKPVMEQQRQLVFSW